MRANTGIQNRPILGGPAFCECNTGWDNAHVINEMGWLTRFRDAVNTLVVMHYPTDNCPNEDGSYPPEAEQIADTTRLFNLFASHYGPMSVVRFASLYYDMVAISQANNLPLVLLETNTASCNGFLGLSDSFLAALWNLDLGMQLASIGFSHAMIHLGGQQAYYNVRLKLSFPVPCLICLIPPSPSWHLRGTHQHRSCGPVCTVTCLCILPLTTASFSCTAHVLDPRLKRSTWTQRQRPRR